jgi:hypothetical protein
MSLQIAEKRAICRHHATQKVPDLLCFVASHHMAWIAVICGASPCCDALQNLRISISAFG